jgi:TPR repeat protein
MYEGGVGGRFTKDELMAEKLYRQAADAGIPEAMYRLGHLYQSGLGRVQRYDPAAYQWYRLAAQQEHAWSPTQEWVLGAARAELGLMLYNGTGVERNPRDAAKWLLKSVAGRLPQPQALQVLGAMYDAGDGVARDPVEAVRHFRMAATHGYPLGMTALGFHLRDGTGVAKNETEAVTWFRKAADLGFPAAEAALGYGYMSSTAGGGVHDDRIAAQWLERAAQHHEPSAQVNLGWLYANGLGVTRDLERAKALWQQSAASSIPRYADAARANLRRLEPARAAPSRGASAAAPRTSPQDTRPAPSPLVRHRPDGSISTGEAVALFIGGALLLSMLLPGSSPSGSPAKWRIGRRPSAAHRRPATPRRCDQQDGAHRDGRLLVRGRLRAPMIVRRALGSAGQRRRRGGAKEASGPGGAHATRRAAQAHYCLRECSHFGSSE